MTIWQIWENPEGSQSNTLPSDDICEHVDVDGVPMLLKHSFEVEGGTIYNREHVDRAFAYSNKWNHDEGMWPRGCFPLDNNLRRRDELAD